MTDFTIDQRFRAVEIAERTMYYTTNKTTSGGFSDYQHKDMRELIRRADSILIYASGTDADDTKSLVTKLREVLCSNPT